MKELFDSLDIADKVSYLLDTCFFIHCFKKNHVKQLEQFCQKNNVGMLSFNLEEFDYIHNHFSGDVKHHVRNFLKKKLISRININVHPGDQGQEREYIKSYDSELFSIVPDPSDAVLYVAALKIRASILTKDKHHIFTAVAQNYAHAHDISIEKEFPKKM